MAPERSEASVARETAIMEILSVQGILENGYISKRITCRTTSLSNNNDLESYYKNPNIQIGFVFLYGYSKVSAAIVHQPSKKDEGL